MNNALGLLMARGGSKRVPRKNIRPFAGQPILLWPLAALKNSGLFSKVIVSSEDPEILRIATEGKAEAPFVRPPELANDHAGTLEVIHHAVDFLAAREEAYTSVCCTYGTSAFLTTEHLAQAQKMLEDAELVMGALRFSHPVERGFTVTPDGVATFPPREFLNKRTQDLPAHYYDAGLFYWLRTDALNTLREPGANMFELRVKPLILPDNAVRDIDTPEDWEMAERIFRHNRAPSPSAAERGDIPCPDSD